ncbi:hypothetical protein PCK1_002756 [Pneumocystis canis]|nr:hypothetical protein PCK1_002756 [Pneumocystis canis]
MDLKLFQRSLLDLNNTYYYPKLSFKACFLIRSIIFKNKARVQTLTGVVKSMKEEKSKELYEIREEKGIINNNEIKNLKLNIENRQKSDALTEFINKTMNCTSINTKDAIYHLHALCSDNNTIITLTNSHYNRIICVTGGMVGFKKSQRGGYEAGYQACISMFERMTKKNIHPTKLEIILRGFGKGREAIFKCINGTEGAPFRPFIYRITDATRLKFGGVRAELNVNSPVNVVDHNTSIFRFSTTCIQRNLQNHIHQLNTRSRLFENEIIRLGNINFIIEVQPLSDNYLNTEDILNPIYHNNNHSDPKIKKMF